MNATNNVKHRGKVAI